MKIYSAVGIHDNKRDLKTGMSLPLSCRVINIIIIMDGWMDGWMNE
jgi:hypothetical protein